MICKQISLASTWNRNRFYKLGSFFIGRLDKKFNQLIQIITDIEKLLTVLLLSHVLFFVCSWIFQNPMELNNKDGDHPYIVVKRQIDFFIDQKIIRNW